MPLMFLKNVADGRISVLQGQWFLVLAGVQLQSHAAPFSCAHTGA